VTAARSELIAAWFGQYADGVIPLAGVLPEDRALGCGFLGPPGVLVLIVDPDMLADRTESWSDEDLVGLLEALKAWAVDLTPFVESGVIPSRAVAEISRSRMGLSNPVGAGLLTRAIGDSGYLGDLMDQGVV
jgi:hypothetical protein